MWEGAPIAAPRLSSSNFVRSWRRSALCLLSPKGEKFLGVGSSLVLSCRQTWSPPPVAQARAPDAAPYAYLGPAASRAHLPRAGAWALPSAPRPRHERPISGGSRGQTPPPPHPSLGAVAICGYACPGAWGWGRGGGGLSRGFGHAHRDRKAVWHGPGRLTLSTHSPAQQPRPWETSPDLPTSP